MPKLRQATLETISKACDGDATTLQPAHVKEILKVTLVAVRQTRRVTQDTKELSSAWQPFTWSELQKTLAKSDRFKEAVGLQAMCKQITELLQDDKSSSKTSAGKSKEKARTKRKAEDTEEGGGEGATESSKKAKHKKARKTKSG